LWWPVLVGVGRPAPGCPRTPQAVLAAPPCLARFNFQGTPAPRRTQLAPVFGGTDDEPVEGQLDRTTGDAFAGLGRHPTRINGALTQISATLDSVSVPRAILGNVLTIANLQAVNRGLLDDQGVPSWKR
jgi:hypothetical protein